MEFFSNLVEYYDELFPVTASESSFFISLCGTFTPPAKYLEIGCGSGALAHIIARTGADATGLEVSKELLESANLRRRTQLTAVRFFKLSSLEMTRFLGKNFYNVIACLNSRIAFIHDQTLLRKFFCDCRILLAPEGALVLQFDDYSAITGGQSRSIQLPERSSIRVKMSSTIQLKENGAVVMNEKIENGSGKTLRIMDDEPIYPVSVQEIKQFSQEAGFTSCTLYSSFEKEPYTDHGPIICIIK